MRHGERLFIAYGLTSGPLSQGGSSVHIEEAWFMDGQPAPMAPALVTFDSKRRACSCRYDV